jgi:hypothetical protein
LHLQQLLSLHQLATASRHLFPPNLDQSRTAMPSTGSTKTKVAKSSLTRTAFLSQFLTWNPEVGGSFDSGVCAEVYVCISIIGHITNKPSSATQKTFATPTSTGCTVAYPEQTQPSSICNFKQRPKPATGLWLRNSILGTHLLA